MTNKSIISHLISEPSATSDQRGEKVPRIQWFVPFRQPVLPRTKDVENHSLRRNVWPNSSSPYQALLQGSTFPTAILALWLK